MTQNIEKSNYEEFKARRELWLYCLKGEERNSLMQQIYQMIWNTAFFRLINEARRLAPPAGDGGVQLNGMIHRFINDIYFENQLLVSHESVENRNYNGIERLVVQANLERQIGARVANLADAIGRVLLTESGARLGNHRGRPLEGKCQVGSYN